jgi:hypothetical protein
MDLTRDRRWRLRRRFKRATALYRWHRRRHQRAVLTLPTIRVRTVIVDDGQVLPHDHPRVRTAHAIFTSGEGVPV